MRIRMFSLCSERDLTQRKIEARIVDSLHGFASNEIEFEDFSTPQEMLAPLAQSLKNEALTIIAVEKTSYNKIKKKLLTAMGYTLTENASIRETVSLKEDIDEKKIASHSLFPAEAKIFPSKDGLFSAFSVSKGSKMFIMLPLDKNRIDRLLDDEILPYLVDLFGEPVEEDVPVQKKEKPGFSDPLVRSVNLLKEANASVAFCANKQEPIIDSVLKKIEGSEDLFVFAPHVEDRGDIDVVSYSVQLARAAKNLSHTELGAVVSDPFDDDNGRGVCISITDGEKAIARRFYAEEGESDESLVSAATEEAISLLGQNAYGVLSENAIGPEAEIREKVAEKKTVKIVLIVIVIILALCIGAGVLFKYLDGKTKEPTTENTTTVTTTETTTEKEVTEPVEEKDLSSYIVDIVKGEDKHEVKKSDEAAPETFLKNGEEMDAKDALALMVQNAINDEDDWNDEALKAMAVVIFTNLKYRNNNFDISDVKLANTADAKVKQAVDAVYGDYLTYEDNVIAALYHRYSAGKTASAETIYGVEIPYLESVLVDSDKRTDDYKYEIPLSTAELNNVFLKTTSQSLFEFSSEPKTWIKIESHDKAFDGDTGYVEKLTVGTDVLSGYDFVKLIEKNGSTKITSLCFDIKYKESEKEFIFTCYGYGSGVGLSQRGAIKMAARNNDTYDEILAYFYPDTELQQVEREEETTTQSTTKAKTNSGSSGTKTTTASTTKPTTTQPVTTTKAGTTEDTTTKPSTTKEQTTESKTVPEEDEEGLPNVSQ